jgi:CDP-glycerol glycerophosphotransferase
VRQPEPSLRRERLETKLPVPRISVVVPFHNNADVLGDCLKSIAAQSFTDIDVIMIDDASVDDGHEIAAAQAAADPRFRLFRVDGGSPGFSRNQGIGHATGEYLSFVDGDDVLPTHALERMLQTLESSGSDFVSGGVERIGPAGITTSGLHAKAIKTRKIGTHISLSPELFFDVSVWNKLFRKSFWDAHHLIFPEGVVWEDLQLMTKAHVLARAVDVIPDPIYYWRERGSGALSITQSRTSIENFRDRITALLVIDEFLREHPPARMVREHQRKALLNDLWLYIPDLGRTTEAYRAEFFDLLGTYLAQIDKKVMRQLPSTHRLAYHLIARHMMPELLEYAGWLNEQPVRTVQVVRERGRIWADLPFRKERKLRIPGRIYRPQIRELDPFVRVEGIDWNDGKLVISGCAYVPSVDTPKRRNTSKIILLKPRKTGRLPVVVPAKSFRHPEAKQWSGQLRYDYDWAGFRAEINPRWFNVAGKWQTGDWEGYVLVRAHGVWRISRLHTPIKGSAERPAARQVAPGIRLGVRWLGKRLHVQVVHTPAELHSSELAGEDLVLEVDVEQAAIRKYPELVLVWSKGTASRKLTTTATELPGGKVRLRGVLPGDQVRDGLVLDFATNAVLEHEARVEWDLCIDQPGAARIRVAFAVDGQEYAYPVGGEEIAVERTRYGNVVVMRRGLRPVIHQHSWSDDGILTLRGSYAEQPGQQLEAVMSRRSSTDTHRLPVQRDGTEFVITVPAAAMPVFGRNQPLRDGSWQLRLRRLDGPDAQELVTPVYDHARLTEIAGERHQFGPKLYRFTTTDYDNPLLTVNAALRLAEHGRIQRRVLRDMYYPLQQRRGLRDAVVFVTFKGKQASDNPLGIASELRRRGDDREHIWAVNDWAVPVPEGARPVLIGTETYWDALARSRYLISNDDMPATYDKRSGQVYVQTWHGTPLKRIGFDVGQLQSISGASYLDHLAEDVAKWDLLLSPSPFSTPILRQAFRFGGDICESGYPRNDVLSAGDSAALAATVRQRIGLPDGKRVVMYAPTWRDNQYYASGRYRFDLRLDLERAWQQLGDDYVILIRGHHHMADDVPAGRPGFVINVTAYPDLAELFLVTDALITDYSSMMCDFAATGKPMLFYTYDLEDYRDNLRGFYLDFESEVPGPLLSTSDEVIAALADLDRLEARYRSKYLAFASKFSPLDDGKAGARACDRIFGG